RTARPPGWGTRGPGRGPGAGTPPPSHRRARRRRPASGAGAVAWSPWSTSLVSRGRRGAERPADRPGRAAGDACRQRCEPERIEGMGIEHPAGREPHARDPECEAQWAAALVPAAERVRERDDLEVVPHLGAGPEAAIEGL